MPAVVIENSSDTTATNTGTYGLIFYVQNKTTSLNIVTSLVFSVTTSAPPTYTLGLKYYVSSTKDSLSNASSFTSVTELTSTNGTFNLPSVSIPASNYMNIFVYVKTNPYSTAIIGRYSSTSTPGSEIPSTYYSSSDFKVFTGNGVDASRNSGSPVPTSWVFNSNVSNQGRIPKLTINYAKASPSPSPSPPRPSPSPSPPRPSPSPSPPPSTYDIIVVAGQSNALGYYSTYAASSPVFETPDPDIHILSRDTLNWPLSTDATNRLSGSAGNSSDKTFSASIDCKNIVTPTYMTVNGLNVAIASEPTQRETFEQRATCCSNFALKFCKLYKQNKLAKGRKILLIHGAIGSTGLTSISAKSKHQTKKTDGTGVSWNSGEAPAGNLGTLLRSRIQTALSSNSNNKLVAILWQQGEEDCENPDTNIDLTATYSRELKTLVDKLRGGTSAPFLAGGFTDWYQKQPIGGITKVLSALKSPSTTITRYYYVGSGIGNALWDDSNNSANGIHYNANGHQNLANLYFRAFSSII
jgi:hypothetical protein